MNSHEAQPGIDSESPIGDGSSESRPPSDSGDDPGAAPDSTEAGPEESAPSQPGAENLEQLRDRHLRVVAEYDNFRKRTARERSEWRARAQADVVAKILDALDDMGRVLDVDPSAVGAKDLIDGVELVERKLLKELETAGLRRVGTVGEAFDPNQHEALGSLPAESADQDQTVGSVYQAGYWFGETLLRPAKVQVRMWQGDAGPGS